MQKRSLAIIFMIISTFSFSIMGAAVKYLTHVPVMEKILIRNFISLIIAAIIARSAGKPLWGSSTKGRILLTVRSLFGLSGVAQIFYATTILNLSDSALFMRLSPFWVTIFATIFLNEKLSRVQIPALFLALGGTVAIMRPWEGSGEFLKLLPAIAGISASICAASAYTLVSKLKHYEDPATIVFFFSFVSVLIAAPLAIKTGYQPSGSEWIGLIIIGVSAAAGQMFLTYAYRMAGAAEVSIFNYVGILFSTILGFIIWEEIPDKFTTIGAIAILSAGWIVFQYGKKNKN